jgi:hypothetical protein
VTAINPAADEDRFSFTPFTRHPFFTYVNRWILERVICPGRQVIVTLWSGRRRRTDPQRTGGAATAPHVIGVDPRPPRRQGRGRPSKWASSPQRGMVVETVNRPTRRSQCNPSAGQGYCLKETRV